ncbi:MAG: F0F1 ATP synthase subunit B [Bacteroidales bacterium]|nr:F0F1 ATP synthase subunit B [Bacteroidales bacterium]
MSLLVPDSGLLFWMLISFGVVFFILAKYAFPVITKSVEERKNYVETSLSSAREAKETLARVEEDTKAIIAEANKEQGRVLNEAAQQRDKIISSAKEEASAQARKTLEEAKAQIQKEKDEAMLSVRREMAALSCDIAEKVLKEKLSDQDSQMALIDKMLEEVVKDGGLQEGRMS